MNTNYGPPVIETERLTIRYLSYNDLPGYTALHTDPRLMQYELRGAFTADEIEDSLKHWAGERNAFDGQVAGAELALELKEEHTLIGVITSAFHDINSQVVEIGFRVHYDYQGRGYATEAVTAFIKKVFQETDAHRIYGCADCRNTACLRVLEKAGMTREGVMKKHVLINGVYSDEVIYAIIKNTEGEELP